ncbi:MAG: FAD synthase [Cyclobacteriaceae bacterium]
MRDSLKVVYVIGVFDLFHTGHVRLLKKAKELGNELIVAINGDDMVKAYKRLPIYSEQHRLELIEACKYVDRAFIIRDFDNKPYIEKFNIDIIVHGDDWDVNGYLEQIRVTKGYLKEQKVELKLLPYTSGISTSEIIERIKSL